MNQHDSLGTLNINYEVTTSSLCGFLLLRYNGHGYLGIRYQLTSDYLYSRWFLLRYNGHGYLGMKYQRPSKQIP